MERSLNGEEQRMGILSNYEPKKPLKYFEELCAIPHGSGNTKAISDYCVEFANERNLKVIQDDLNNIIITKEATPGYENEVGIIIQGHLDMVCVKTTDSTFDFDHDGLILETDGKKVWAKDTSLGGDDGIAIAIALAILDSDDIEHPQIEAVFTVDEEIGLLGALDIDLSSITGKKLINIDSEDDTMILTSCAGGTFLECSLPIKFELQRGMVATIELKGLQGGHSGAEIHKERVNSNVMMGRILNEIKEKSYILDLFGGTATNVIPSRTETKILYDEIYSNEIKAKLESLSSILKKEFAIAEPDFKIVLNEDKVKDGAVLNENSHSILINALMNLPNGVHSWSLSIKDLVETSSNLGICKIVDECIVIDYSIRSSVDSARDYVVTKIISLVEFMGGSTKYKGSYPGWEYRMDSPLRDTVINVYKQQFGKEPIIAAIHAGLECGLFSDKIEDLDCVSIGPNLHDIHSVSECMELESTERIWKLVLGVLKTKNQ